MLLAEVTLDSTREWAPDITGSFGIDTATVTGQAGLGKIADILLGAMGVPSLEIATSDFNLLLRALESQGRLQILSNPSIMAANNQPAMIQVGENIGRAESQSISDGGTQQTGVRFEDIGVILNVTPSINPDGFVRMVIEPSITDLTNRKTEISEDLEVNDLTKRTLTTTVTVRDGQTIVLGGLISDQFERRMRKVPLLGDIPLIGALFRSELRESTTIELLIVLTPHVITSPAELSRVRELTDGEIERLSLTAKEKESLQRSRLEPMERKAFYSEVTEQPDED